MKTEAIVIPYRASDGNTIRIEYRDSLPSTFELAKQYAESGYPDRYAVFCEKQTAVSSVGEPLSGGDEESGLFLSCILRPSIFPSQIDTVKLISAVALAKGVEEHAMKSIGIGWVSDIYCDGVRIGSASIDEKPDNSTSYEYLIINFYVKLDKKKFPPRLTDRVRKVFEDGNRSIPMIIAKTILDKFFTAYKEIKAPENQVNQYVSKFILNDKKIKYLDGGKKRRARIVGINKENLHLVIETRKGNQIDVSSPSSVILPSKI